MAFGATQPNGGGGSRRPPRPPSDAPPEQQPPPPRGGAGAPPSGTVDEARVSQLALASLPTADDFAAYVAFSETELPNIAGQIVAASQVNVGALVTEII